jgi:hypothetical protein
VRRSQIYRVVRIQRELSLGGATGGPLLATMFAVPPDCFSRPGPEVPPILKLGVARGELREGDMVRVEMRLDQREGALPL